MANKAVGGKKARNLKRRLARLEILRGRREDKKKRARRLASHAPKKRPESIGEESGPKYDKTIQLPKNFSLLDNYSESIDRINEIRKINRDIGKKRSVYVDFDHIEKIGAGAALVLAAEFEVANINGHQWDRALDKNWNPKVRDLLYDIGFYQFLGLQRSSTGQLGAEDRNEKFLKFFSGKADIKTAGKLISGIGDKIKEFAGNDFPSLMLLKSSISEAVLNTRYHAYPKIIKSRESSRWWISASLDKSNKEIKIICYDRGQSIPKTLILKFQDIFRDILSVMQFSPQHDALLIESAIKENRTSSKQEGRGNGLPQLKGFIDNFEIPEGELIVMSRNGKVTYHKPINGEPQWKTENLSKEIAGTLIVWSIILDKI